MFQEVPSWFILFYVLFLPFVSLLYYIFLHRKEINILRHIKIDTSFIFLLIIPPAGTVILSVLVLNFLLYQLPPVNIITYFVISGFLTIIMAKKSRVFRCSKEIPIQIGRLEFIICHEGPVNAWYDRSKKKIYISSKILTFVNRKELEAIWFHEEGHKISKYSGLFTMLFFVFWIWFASTIIATDIVLYILNLSYEVRLSLLMIAIPLAASYSLMVTLWNWLNEHMADLHSVKEVGAFPIISALSKIYMYAEMENRGISSYAIRPPPGVNIRNLNMRKHSFWYIIWILFKESIKNAYDIFSYKIPLPETHPPLELRIRKILTESS
jgi:Zn-dependent protease with chaperone function